MIEATRIDITKPGGNPRKTTIDVEPPITRPRGIVEKAAEFLRVVSGPKVADRTYRERISICKTCAHRREHKGADYCGACGCPKWSLARLDTKLRFARLECPDGKFNAADESEVNE